MNGAIYGPNPIIPGGGSPNGVVNAGPYMDKGSGKLFLINDCCYGYENGVALNGSYDSF